MKKLLVFLLMLHVIMVCPAPPQFFDNPSVVKSRLLLPCLGCELLVKLSSIYSALVAHDV